MTNCCGVILLEFAEGQFEGGNLPTKCTLSNSIPLWKQLLLLLCDFLVKAASLAALLAALLALIYCFYNKNVLVYTLYTKTFL